MRAVVFDASLRVVDDYPVPELRPGWARIHIQTAGICKTDLELIKGYRGFKGVLGHEFIGVVEACGQKGWIGKKVVGEINAACGHCEWCRKGLGHHCPARTTLGIMNHDGCMADYCILPVSNLIEIPPDVSDDRAVFTEPLSAACEIIEQLPLTGTERAVVLGDGRLGILCAWALSTVLSDVTLVGHHPEKLQIAKWRHIQTATDPAGVSEGADIVVDATGSATGLNDAIRLCRPRGTIVLKTTIANQCDINLAPVVVNEINIIGSRCGQFRDGIKMLQGYPDMPLTRLITDRYPIAGALAAFDRATRPDAIKVLLQINALPEFSREVI
ncbi:MAG: alcohol dehydrogenase [Deltaproteobacteria bacterium HGW-Deltaproteobacteria-6]|jgi:alcohol dehydrogenase|nr:MAG: alcohol dehydrogenase [Deltaproteobacteria bacterium HGW-Deltaproteobacteria-6]